MANPFTLDRKCGGCQEKFSLDDRIAHFQCSEQHWYHYNCMIEQLDAGNTTCAVCQQNPRDEYSEEVTKHDNEKEDKIRAAEQRATSEEGANERSFSNSAASAKDAQEENEATPLVKNEKQASIMSNMGNYFLR